MMRGDIPVITDYVLYGRGTFSVVHFHGPMYLLSTILKGPSVCLINIRDVYVNRAFHGPKFSGCLG